MLNAIASWLLTRLLDYLLGKAIDEAQAKLEQVKKDRERDVLNEENTRAYEEALERKERIDAALKLLNR